VRIHKAIIENYKSIYRPLELELGGGVTLFVGMNNSGKSAILEVLSSQFQGNPHRSSYTIPKESFIPHPESSVMFTLSENFDNSFFKGQDATIQVQLILPSQEIFSLVARGLKGDGKILYKKIVSVGSINQPPSELLVIPQIDEVGIGVENPNSNHYSLYRDTNGNIGNSSYSTNNSYTLPSIIAATFLRTVYWCSAKRFVSGVSSPVTHIELEPGFGNLAGVLLRLQANPIKFDKYNELIRKVLPFISHVSLKPVSDGQPKVQILVWTDIALPDREDLATPLDDAGSGVGQVLGILYLLVTSSDPRVIVIDEISNFLYPAAARKLLEVFAQYPQHQYLVSTHSADLLGHRAVERIYHVQLQDGQTQVDLLDKNDVDAMRLLLLEIGASISELYGAERILWVEGPTEERGFKDILKAFYNMSLVDCVLVGVHHTGDFEQKKGGQKRLIFNVYRKLSEAHSLLPKSIGFVFDREGRTEREIQDLERESGGTAHVLERRLYENYLLDPEAIHALLEHERQKSLEDGSDWTTPVTSEQVETWLSTHHGDKSYQASASATSSFLSNTDWLRDVHGADLLHDLFNEISDSKLSYKSNKVTFSVWLTGWLLEHKKNNLNELAQFLKGVLD